MAIKVLIVDDSATARAVLKDLLSDSSLIEIVGTATDAYIARDMIVKKAPNVICLDIEMPRMDGITFLKKIMKYKPTPVVMVSSLTQKGAQMTLDALEAGAVDFVGKPHANIYEESVNFKEELIAKVIAASKSKVLYKSEPEEVQEVKRSLSKTTKKIVAMGASTGGTEALKDILTKMPADSPGMVIVQHMPGSFTSQFAKRLNSVCKISVKEAKSGDFVTQGEALIAPGDFHMVLRRSGHRYYVEIGDGKAVSGHKPSIDVLFNSIAKTAGANAVGVILTGMGSDGAKGLKNMRNEGAKTIAQDKKSCTVFGMPKVAVEIDAVDEVVPLSKIPQMAIDLVESMEEN